MNTGVKLAASLSLSIARDLLTDITRSHAMTPTSVLDFDFTSSLTSYRSVQ